MSRRRVPVEGWRDVLSRLRRCIFEAEDRGFAVHLVMTTIVNAEEFDDIFLETTDKELFCNVWTKKDLESYDRDVIDIEDCIDSVCMYSGLLDLPSGQRPLDARGVPGECANALAATAGARADRSLFSCASTEGEDGGYGGVSIVLPKYGKQHKNAAKKNKGKQS